MWHGYRSAWRPFASPAPEVVELRERASLRAGLVYLATVVIGFVYLLLTEEPISKPWFAGLLVVGAGMALLVLLPWSRLLSHRFGALLILARSTLGTLLISLAIGATGGKSSQLWVLYGVGVLFVGWCFDAATAYAFTAVICGLYVGAMAGSGGLPARGPLFARLAGLGILALGVAFIAKESREQSERALVSARESAALAEARRAVAEQAQRLNGLQSEFVSTVSHELRTPLTAIIGNLATLQRGVVRDQDVADSLLAAAARHAKRLDALIEDLLTTSRLDEDELRVHQEQVDVLEVVSDVVAQLQVARPDGDLSLVVDGPVPACALTDRDHLHRVVLNLADNALKYGDGAAARVRVGMVRDRIRFVVEDDGPGVDPEHHLRIFERFAQVENGQRKKVGGTGLGLHICCRLVERLGGHLMMSSLPDHGAAFGFTLPAWVEESTAEDEDDDLLARAG